MVIVGGGGGGIYIALGSNVWKKLLNWLKKIWYTYPELQLQQPWL